MQDDRELLRRYADQGDEIAFAELVRRHLNLVYSAALRQVGDSSQAGDVAQLVFTDLARKARKFPEQVTLAAWLHRATRFSASQQRRTDQRRAHREQEAIIMQLRDQNHPEPCWNEVRGMLDEALDSLPAPDRDALMLRYFEQRSLEEVGSALGGTSEAARKRVSRALERLREALQRRGVTATSVALSGALTAHAVQMAPPLLASTISAAAVSSAAAASSTTGIALITAMTALKTITTVGVALALAGGLYLQYRQIGRLRAENEQLRATQADAAAVVAAPQPSTGSSEVDSELVRLRGEVSRLRSQQSELARLQTEIRQLRQQRAKPTPAQAANNSDDADKEEFKRIAIAKMNCAKQLGMAIMLFADAHNRLVPRNFQEAAQYIPKEATSADTDPDHFELMYQGSLNDIPADRWQNTIVVREKEQFVIKSDNGVSRAYGFADGHSEIHKSADGNFEPWEQARLIIPQN